MLFYREMNELRELLRCESAAVPLDLAALQIASIQYPDLELEPFLVLLESHATEFGERVNARTGTEEFIDLLNAYLFEELGFQGNSDDYYDPANSCLNEVLIRRTGIPISLSLVYMEVARRLGRKVHGVGLPGHFLVMVDEPGYRAFIDPFHQGQSLTEEECYELAREATGMDLADDEAMLAPVPNRHVALRMLNNLRAVYFQRNDPKRAEQVLDLLIEASPESAEEYKQRGVCRAQLGLLDLAQADLQTYLRLAPSAVDRPQVVAELERLKRLRTMR